MRVWKAIYVPAELEERADELIGEALQKLRVEFPVHAVDIDDDSWDEEEELMY